jgi:SNF2 family DNA or RNA helicase
MLTGTPVMNRPAELVSQLTVMDRLGEFAKSGADFMRKYGSAGKKDDERSAQDRRSYVELNDKMRATCFIRRTKAQVLTELPPKQRSVIPIELDNWKEYIAAESQMIRDLIERHRDLAKARAQRIAEDLASIETLKQLAVRGMMAPMGEWLEDFLASDQKLILFGWHKWVIHEMSERFDAEYITGETPLAERDRIMAAFQTDPSVKLIVGNIQAMGVGVTLTAASTVNFMELGWNPAVMDQAEDRAHRLGQHDSVNANYFIGIGTIYERIMKLIDAKRLVVSAATDGRMAPREQSILSDLIADLTGTPNEEAR